MVLKYPRLLSTLDQPKRMSSSSLHHAPARQHLPHAHKAEEAKSPLGEGGWAHSTFSPHSCSFIITVFA